MPRYRRYRRRGRRRGAPWRRYTYGGIAKKALHDVAQLKKFINTEQKSVNLQVSKQIGTTASIELLSGVAQGDGSSQRTGESIKHSSLLIRSDFTISSSANNVLHRYIVFYDRQPNTDMPTAQQLLSMPTDIRTPLNTDYGKRFKVLRDKFFVLSTEYPRKPFEFFIRLQRHSEFDGDGDSVNSATTNHIFSLVFTTDDTNQTQFNQTSRMRYIDN